MTRELETDWPNHALQRTRRLRLCCAIRFQSCSAPGRRVAELGSLGHFAAFEILQSRFCWRAVSEIRSLRLCTFAPLRFIFYRQDAKTQRRREHLPDECGGVTLTPLSSGEFLTGDFVYDDDVA